MKKNNARQLVVVSVLLLCVVMAGCGCGKKKKDPATQQVLKISITPEPSPSPEPDKMDQNAVVKNGNITMVNEYLVNRGQAEDKETDSRTDKNFENSENPEQETDSGSETGDQEDVIEE